MVVSGKLFLLGFIDLFVVAGIESPLEWVSSLDGTLCTLRYVFCVNVQDY